MAAVLKFNARHLGSWHSIPLAPLLSICMEVRSYFFSLALLLSVFLLRDVPVLGASCIKDSRSTSMYSYNLFKIGSDSRVTIILI